MGEMTFSLLDQGNASNGTGIFNGVNINCYDGNPFFSALHSEGLSGTQTNVGTGVLNNANLRAAITAMNVILDDQGKPLYPKPNLLVVHPNEQWTAKGLLKSVYYPEATVTGANVSNNVLNGVMELYITPYISAGHWFILDTSRIVKPLMLQIRRQIAFDSVITGYEQFMRKKLFYGCDWRGQAAFAMWQYAYGSFP